jgi:hypothetical protein
MSSMFGFFRLKIRTSTGLAPRYGSSRWKGYKIESVTNADKGRVVNTNMVRNGDASIHVNDGYGHLFRGELLVVHRRSRME